MRLPCPAEGLAGIPRLSSVTDPHSSPHDIVIIVSGADATLRCKNCGISRRVDLHRPNSLA
jgi:hypothetical protein